jgi:hypothetical protein
MLSTEFKVNIEKDGGDIAFITYEKGGAEALVGRPIIFSNICIRVQRFEQLGFPRPLTVAKLNSKTHLLNVFLFFYNLNSHEFLRKARDCAHFC